MDARAALLAFALLALPLAGATYGEGGALDAAAPATLQGRAETWLPSGTASFVSSSASTFVGVALTAPELAYAIKIVEPGCEDLNLPTGPTTCPPGSYNEMTETGVIRDAVLTVLRATSAFKVIATTDRVHADTPSFGDDGRILVTTATSSLLGTNPDGVHLSMIDRAWTADSESSEVMEPIYDAEAYSAQLSSAAAVLQATGGFEAFFQGVQVRVQGTTEDGERYDETFDTRMPASASEPYTAVIVEVTDGDLKASGSAPFIGYAPADQRPVTDVHQRVAFSDAKGTLVQDGNSDELTGEDVTLQGPVSLTLTKITSGAAPRLAYAIVDGLQLTALDEQAKDDPIPPGALAAAGAAGAGGAGALLALAYFWPRLKYAWTLALLPMYTRIERDSVLEHEKRDELYELIRGSPGIHAHEIGEKAKIGWGTTVYHLKLLENHGLVVSKKSGRYKRFFVNTGEYTKKKDIYGALRNETAKSVAQFIVDHPGTTQKDMCTALGIQPSLASWHVEKLEGVELVKRVKDGRMVRYFAGPAWADLNVRIDPLGGGADTPAET